MHHIPDGEHEKCAPSKMLPGQTTKMSRFAAASSGSCCLKTKFPAAASNIRSVCELLHTSSTRPRSDCRHEELRMRRRTTVGRDAPELGSAYRGCVGRR